MLIAQTPLRRIATPEDIAGPVLFLASEWSRFVTGQISMSMAGW
jgi:3-oxoacyl-[acyl-carrier protein] reductase